MIVFPEEFRLICVSLSNYFVILIPPESNVSVIYLHNLGKNYSANCYCYSANPEVLREI